MDLLRKGVDLRIVARWVLIFEPLILLAAVYFFWFPSNFPADFPVEPVDRADWMWLLGLLIPIYIARFIAYGRLWTFTLLDGLFIAFIVLGVLNVSIAPYPSRGVGMLARPVLGFALVIYFVELTRTSRSIEPALKTLVILSWLVGIVALGMTQWNEKSADLRPIIDTLPRISTFIVGGFNPNEVAGAMAWLAPLMAGIVFYPWRKRDDQQFSGWAVGAGVGFALLLLALLLGQSRFALVGVLVTLFAVAVLIVPRGLPRGLTIGVLALLTLFQANLVLNVVSLSTPEQQATASTGLTARDERTFNQRFDMWESALNIVIDHPLSGVGMNRFRFGPVRQAYPIPGFDIPYEVSDGDFTPRIVPHAHNEFAQIATDLGVPGLLVFVGWYVVVGYMLWWAWWHGKHSAQVVAVSVAAGLLAHMAYGIGDAVTLWDRFAFVFWLLVGVAAAQYILARNRLDDGTESGENAHPHRATNDHRTD